MTEQRGVLGLLGKTVISVISSPTVWIPFLLLVIATVVFRFTNADMALARRFFVGEGVEHWPLMETYPWKALYENCA